MSSDWKREIGNWNREKKKICEMSECDACKR